MLETLHSQKHALDCEIAETRRQVKLVCSKIAHARASRARHWVLTGQARDVALSIYLMADYRTEPAVVYLKRICRERHYPARSDAEIAHLVVDEFLKASTEYLLHLGGEEATCDATVTSTALSYVDEWRVAEWTLAQNLKGVAPCTPSVLCQFEALRSARPERLRLSSWGLSTNSSTRKRVCRWRKRFGGRVGKLRTQEEISLDVLRFKVLSFTA